MKLQLIVLYYEDLLLHTAGLPDSNLMLVCIKAAGCDAENLKQILHQIRTSSEAPSETDRQLTHLKALTEQLKRGSTAQRPRTTDTQLDPAAAHTDGSLSPELGGGAASGLEELQTLSRTMGSNLQLLQPYVTFLRTAQQV